MPNFANRNSRRGLGSLVTKIKDFGKVHLGPNELQKTNIQVVWHCFDPNNKSSLLPRFFRQFPVENLVPISKEEIDEDEFPEANYKDVEHDRFSLLDTAHALCRCLGHCVLPEDQRSELS